MGPDARVAVYYAPQPNDELSAAAASWLGRDAAGDAAVPQPAIDGLSDVTAEPRVYGFHATLKPPMRLAAECTWDDVVTSATIVASGIAPFELPRLSVQDVSGFLALRETTPSMPLPPNRASISSMSPYWQTVVLNFFISFGKSPSVLITIDMAISACAKANCATRFFKTNFIN